MKAIWCGALAITTLGTACDARAQTVPVRTVHVAIASDSGALQGVAAVRHIAGGRVLVNDATRRRLVMFDSTLTRFTILADTAPGAPNTYGARQVGLLAHQSDSSLFVDAEAGVLVVIDPAGKFVRVMAPPKTSDLGALIAPFCSCGVDPWERLIYAGRRAPPPNAPPLAAPPPSDGAGVPVITRIDPDSAPIIRADFDTRTLDTIALMKIPFRKSGMISVQARGLEGFSVFNPLPVTDEWALLPDGTIAIVRASDYHMDWIHPDGRVTSSPKMPFAWKRITIEEKRALLDSVKVAGNALRAAARAKSEYPDRPLIPFLTVEPSDLWDFYPPVRQGQVKADREGNVWILPSTAETPTNDGLVFDVVNREGKIFERVQLPAGRNLAGFGPGGILYMIYAPSPGRILLERGRVVR
jgi:hypothetical protein